MSDLKKSRSTHALPLAGIRIIDYSHFPTGPHMSRCLSAVGAVRPAWVILRRKSTRSSMRGVLYAEASDGGL